MNHMNPLRLHSRALTWAVVGTVAVFAGVTLVNQLTSAPEPDEEASSRQIEMVRQQPPPPPPKPQKQPEPPPRQAKAPPPPPMSGLSQGLSGVDLGLNFGSWEFGSVDESLLGKSDDVVMTGDTVDVAPRPQSRGAMPYPPEARAKGVEGYVLVSLLINQRGEVTEAKVVEAQPSGVFDEVVLSAIRQWQFTPAEYKGEKVKVWANQRIRFDLS